MNHHRHSRGPITLYKLPMVRQANTLSRKSNGSYRELSKEVSITKLKILLYQLMPDKEVPFTICLNVYPMKIHKYLPESNWYRALFSKSTRLYNPKKEMKLSRHQMFIKLPALNASTIRCHMTKLHLLRQMRTSSKQQQPNSMQDHDLTMNKVRNSMNYLKKISSIMGSLRSLNNQISLTFSLKTTKRRPNSHQRMDRVTLQRLVPQVLVAISPFNPLNR